MAKRGVTIYHNPKCTTSCNVLAMIEEAGVKPTIIEYLKTGWSKAQLKDLFAAAGVTPRRALRTKSKEAEEPACSIRKSPAPSCSTRWSRIRCWSSARS